MDYDLLDSDDDEFYDDFYDDYYDDFDDDDDDLLTFPGGSKKGGIKGAAKAKAATHAGSGYGGDGNDKKKRTAGRNEAKKREAKTWKNWQTELRDFLKQQQQSKKGKAKKKTDSDDVEEVVGVTTVVSPKVLNTLKQVLRCQAPEWWWKQPQRNLYITALQVCVVLTRHHPRAWGDPEDDESAMAALEQLAQTSALLAKQNDNDDTTAVNNTHEWLANQLKRKKKGDTTIIDDKDASLPCCILKIRDEAAAAVKKVLEAPDCSMMGSHDYYRQQMRPLAFATVESFSNPIHFYAAGGGHERDPRAYSHSKKSQPKKKGGATNKKGGGGDSIQSSARVLWKELSTYPTALPIEYGSSVFVRAVEGEMDKLRVLIIGPEDTPYANGCFLFDVTMGNDYPHKPPKVQFLTTSSFLCASSQKVRFNPNLYDCGKVCLSLLGTWSGPSWNPGESTLLQVLVSLQSLILGTPDPYFNEPGFQSSEGTPHGTRESEKYNANIRKQTLRVAILPFLQNQLRDGTTVAAAAASRDEGGKRKDPPGQDATNTRHFAEFQDVIAQHFKLKKQAVRKQLFDWLQKDKSNKEMEQLYSEYWNVCDQLDEAARKQAAVTSGGTASRRQKRAKKMDAPAVKMKDNVILLDDDDDDMQQALANSMAGTSSAAKPAAAAKPKEDGDGVILLDSEDEDTSKKPAAVDKTSSSAKLSGGGDADEEKKQAGAASPPKVSEAENDDVVDLT